jgi:hypothetical protein
MGPTATKLGSWVFIFSKFTPEALLFEAFAILCLTAAYLAFWVLRKRRMGSIEDEVPAGLVKVYLNQLIGEAEQLRAQLFGLLTGASPAAGQTAALRGITPDLLASISAHLPAATPGAGSDHKLQALEAKMNEQAKAMDAVVVEKKRIEKELADARAAGAKSGGTVDDGMIAKLQEKIRVLEGKLAEYAVIEDDLANLKRLQQENAQLRSALSKGGAAPQPAAGAAPAATPAPVAAKAAAPVAAVLAAEPSLEPSVAAVASTPAAQAAAASPEPAVASVPSGATAAPAEEAGFEALVDEVEKSLHDEPAPGAGATVPPMASPAPSSPSSLESILSSSAIEAGAPNQEKTDADLVAEFEKMLKG